MSLQLAKLIPWLPALSAVVCGICCIKRPLRKLAAPVCVLSILAGFVITLGIQSHVTGHHEGGAVGQTVTLFEWVHAGSFHVDMAYYLDPLTIVMLFVVTGIGTLVALYASGYMAGDRGYARFFAYVSIFIFAMTTLVLADNLVLLYLGWEGVGLCSYLLIGFYYQKPSAVAAAKKAFIVNRIGDLGFALGIFLTFHHFGQVTYTDIFNAAALYHAHGVEVPWTVQLIPYLLMLGAFGKSAQIPLYVWLPDAMEGPTPVSALIHAATMVTAGVYMIARLTPLFMLSPGALELVAIVGCVTALFAGTIALCQYDIKRIYAYSTISQLGYMFLGVGVLCTSGAVFHLFTHAFFKALLFLTAGSVMHALAGQLDLRKMSGLRRKMPVTCWLMFAGCLALAGFPFTAGFYSKDEILAAVMEKGLTEHSALYITLAVLGLFTAFLTAFYTFRLWFRVFMGPEKYEMGEEHHSDEDSHTTQDAAHGSTSGGIEVAHHHEPHEMPLFPMNLPLVVLAAGALLAGVLGHRWMAHMIGSSSAAVVSQVAEHGEAATETTHHLTLLPGVDLHTSMMIISSVIAVLGIVLAAYYHWLNRPAADRLASQFKGLVTLLANKYYIDEINDAVIVKPLNLLGQVFFAVDQLIVMGLVQFVGFVPRALGLSIQPTQQGKLQGYGLGMAAGAAIIALLVVMAMH
ncbi:MAG: NADH-quinone oxidoreductase subunit L [Phycisphaera sp.]|nr:NADH-quinone oxidoreductase subunit L [Phycisphaera sp.]